MFLVGLILFAAAVAAAIIGIVQTRHLVIDVHALGQTWTVHAYWVLVAGLIVAVVGLLGLSIINRGAERSRRRRRERRALAREIGASVSWRRKIVTTSPRSALRMLTRPWTCRRGSADAGRRGEHVRARLLSRPAASVVHSPCSVTAVDLTRHQLAE
jgi:hypothetical protein